MALVLPSSFGDVNGILDQIIGDELKGTVEDRKYKTY